jgi:hypothetical protein
MGDLHKIKWSGETIFGISQLLHMLCIKWDAKYHVTTWCEMQTVVWMTYSNSTHFSDKNSYKILLILSYGLKDINFARLTHLQEFFWKTEMRRDFLTEDKPSPGRWPVGPERLMGRCSLQGLLSGGTEADGWSPPVRSEKGNQIKKCWLAPELRFVLMTSGRK